jgi:hypothetical protein
MKLDNFASRYHSGLLLANGKRAIRSSVKLITVALGMGRCSWRFPGDCQLPIGFATREHMPAKRRNAKVFGAFWPDSVMTRLTAFPQIMLKQQLQTSDTMSGT